MADFNTNPGDRSVSELEREVDGERERVSATIDELQSRASMSNIVDQVVKAVGENGGEVSRNLGRSLRDNPMAALLTGVGVAWLMAGSGGPARRQTDWESDDPRYRAGTDPDWRTFGVSADTSRDTTVGGMPTGSTLSDDETSSSSGPGIGQRVSDATGRIGERVSDAVDGLRERASDFTHAAGDRVGQAGDAVRGAGASARHHAGSARRGAAGTGRDLQNSLDRLIEDQPLVLGAIAMALGAAVGGAMPRTRAEDKMFGERSDRAKDAVMSMAEEQGAKVQASASAVVDEAIDIAHEASGELGSRLPSADEIVGAADAKARDAADRLRDAAKSQPAQSQPGTASRPAPGRVRPVTPAR